MYKLMRYFNQNRKAILTIVLIIVFAIIILQLLNYLVKRKNDVNNIEINNVINENIQIDNTITSDKSAISGQNVSNTKLEKDTKIISKFMEYCNLNDIENAYNLLTDECKEQMFPTIQDFYNIYYLEIFNGENKIFTTENWIGNTYEVRITGDILSTGKLDSEETYQDYMTIVDDKLNINNYVGREKVEKNTEEKGIAITVESKDIYMDYEIYNIVVQNNSKNTILLDKNNNPKTVYLLDNNDMKYYFYNNEIVSSNFQINSQYKVNLKIKFANTYTSSRRIKSLVFSNLILNYDEYKILENKNEYENYCEFRAQV